MRTAAPLLTLLLLLGCAPEEEDIEIVFRPQAGCPPCTIKEAQFTIPPAAELGRDVEIGPATLVHSATLTHDCPNGRPPCDITERKDLGVLEPDEYIEPLLIPTDWNLGDTEEAAVDVMLVHRDGSQSGPVTIRAEVIE